ncbi:nucleoside diphosphate-linked moiety X motif 17 isoform X1 [Periophthalmus magnuspinnatus]|uniref:nucleoside diphosphate-linked moiety X motif 17 isoform X1 n=1 Tax=Periophthalmus magnuspinnatus TaxID=409849 RepID=UPI00145A43D8|nr:nucleoside diphosphate-linked moiety X motif 17 isoform X1 [Periophthalmus magnuspinnatus]
METLRRVLVFVAKDRSSPQKVQFLQSVVGLLDSADDELKVNFKLEQNQFILIKDSSPQQVPLRRPSFCPIKHLSITEAAAIPLDVRQRGVDVGVAILLQSSDQRLLLTRRAKHLRIFPNVWVPPGGHIEPDETVLEAGLRELKEETGLHLEQDQVHTRILGLWESVFPAMLSRGLPQRHHIVVYILLMTPRDHQQLQEDLSPSALEVSACLWAEPRLIRAALSKEDYSKDSVRAYEVSLEGSLKGVSIPVSVFKTSAPDHGPDLERISTGTKYALRLWLQDLTGPETGLDLNPDWS